MGEHLETHQRHADEIGDLLALDQPHRLLRVPARHQHQLASHGEALEQHRDLGGDVEQRHVEQRRGLQPAHHAVLRSDRLHHQRGRQEIERGLHHLEMRGQRAARTPGGTGGEQDRRRILAAQRRPRAALRAREHRIQRGLQRLRIVERLDQPVQPGESLHARRIGEDQPRRDFRHRGLQFLGLPPAVQQGRDAARHRDAHVEHDPRRRVAGRDADAVAGPHAISVDQRMRDARRGVMDLPVRQPLLPRDQEGQVAVLGTEMREIGRQRRGRGGDARQRAPEPLHRAERQRPPLPGHCRDRGIHACIQLGPHHSLRLGLSLAHLMEARFTRGKP